MGNVEKAREVLKIALEKDKVFTNILCIISRRMKRVDENQSVPVIYSLDTLIFCHISVGVALRTLWTFPQ